MRGVQRGPALGVVAQVAALAALAAMTGLTTAGWLVGVLAGAGTGALLARALVRSDAVALGRANAVTLTRGVLAGGVAALAATDVSRPTAVTPVVTLAVVALALDGVDGWVARRTGTVTPLGARFDGEVDAFLILALSVLAIRPLGWWVLSIGLMRYAFYCAGVLRWMRAPLPRRDWRKVVAAVQGIVLTVAVARVLPRPVAEVASAAALALLVESFGRDVWWLRRQRVAAAPTRLGRAVSATIGVAGAVLLWVAFVAPDRLTDVRVTTFLRIPIEALAVVALAVVLPARPRWFVTVIAGLTLAALTVVRALDMGFGVALDRPFNPVSDWYLVGPGLGVLRDSVGGTEASLIAVGVVALVVAAFVAVTAAMVRVTRVAARHRTRSLQAVVALGVVWGLAAAVAGTTASGGSFASASAARVLTAQVQLVRTSLHDQRTFSGDVTAADRYAISPGTDLLTGLRGKDVLLVFVESYGRVALEGTVLSRLVDPMLDEQARALSAAGYSSRSAFLTSPTFGGGSWLAHSTLQSGLWINGQQRYDRLVRSGRLTLSGAFKRAGWRTVVDVPSSPSPWQQGEELYHFDTMYGTHDVGYAGPSFSYAKIPDQYTLAALYQRELATQPRRPVMAEVDLVSSHAPWAPLPRMLPWQDLGDGEVFRPMPEEGSSPGVVWGNRDRVVVAYGESIRYSMTALTSFLRTVDDPDLVVVMLGDHQPNTTVSGSNASHDVPISIVARDPAVLSRIGAWGWQDGLRPTPDAPVWRMDEFRNRFLTAYGPVPVQGPSARSAAR